MFCQEMNPIFRIKNINGPINRFRNLTFYKQKYIILVFDPDVFCDIQSNGIYGRREVFFNSIYNMLPNC